MATTDYDTRGESYVRRKYFRDKLVAAQPSLATDPELLYGSKAETKYFELINAGAITDSGSSMYINVKTFGATGDGVTDDRLAIQNAIDSVPTGGAIVYFPRGDYAIGGTLTVPKDGTSLVGEGAGNRIGATQNNIGTRIKAKAGISGSLILVQRTENDRPVHGVNIRDLAIDGNTTGTLVDGLIYRCNQGRIDRVNIWNCTGNGLKVSGYTSPSWDTYDSMFSHMLIGENALAGVYLDAKANDTHWDHCVVLGNRDNM